MTFLWNNSYDDEFDVEEEENEIPDGPNTQEQQ